MATTAPVFARAEVIEYTPTMLVLAFDTHLVRALAGSFGADLADTCVRALTTIFDEYLKAQPYLKAQL